MKRLLFVGIIAIFSLSLSVQAQNNVGIGTTTPNASALLDLTATDMGLLVPRVALTITTSAAPVTSPATSLLVYNTATVNDVTPGFYYWNGSAWVQVGAGGGGCVTLDEAYDCGGPGVGDSITADNGSVKIELPATGTSNAAFDVFSYKALSWSIGALNTNTGVGVLATITGTTNIYNAIQGSSFSNFVNATGLGSGGVAGFYEGTGNGVGVYGGVMDVASTGEAGVFGYNARTDDGYGVEGQGIIGVLGMGTGTTSYGWGVYGYTEYGSGVQGETEDSDNYGLVGRNYATIGTGDGIAILGDGITGVWGQTSDGTGYGVFGYNDGAMGNGIGVAGYGFNGVVGETYDLVNGWGLFATGDIGATGTKFFVIDHPTDPENKMLRHFCIESNEVLNMYRGVAAFDSNGEAVITLPDYFESININYSYQLTPIGDYANLYIKQKIEDGQFIIAGGHQGMEVSWTVYAERNDALYQQYPEKRQVEVEKDHPGYLNPELYGKTRESSYYNANIEMQNTGEMKDASSDKSGRVEPFNPTNSQ